MTKKGFILFLFLEHFIKLQKSSKSITSTDIPVIFHVYIYNLCLLLEKTMFRNQFHCIITDQMKVIPTFNTK